MILTEDWEFNILGIYNYRRPGRLRHYLDFIADNHETIEGDVCEAGVYKGKSLLATALLLKELGSSKKVIGYDSFRGLPEVHPKDNLMMFNTLSISEEHRQQIARFWSFREFMLGKRPTLRTVSAYAGDMADVDLNLLVDKINFLGLDNIEIGIGPFNETMVGERKFMAALIDCDLYESYKTALPFVWERLSPGGFIYFDEYYSLKFPGARIACDEFLADKEECPECLSANPGEFERWGVFKNA